MASTASASTCAAGGGGGAEGGQESCKTTQGGWRAAQDVFHEWAQDGRDERMASGHAQAVREILGEALPHVGKDSFTAIDAGCGNGWVARKLKTIPGCVGVIGVDGAPGMIERAQEIDPEGKYGVVDLTAWNPDRPVDLVHSMEVLYYLGDDLEATLERIHSRWLKPGGVLAAGVDFYADNEKSLDWPDIYHMRMRALGEKEWEKALKTSGFKDVKIWRAARSDSNEAGTLAMVAVKARGEA